MFKKGDKVKISENHIKNCEYCKKDRRFIGIIGVITDITEISTTHTKLYRIKISPETYKKLFGTNPKNDDDLIFGDFYESCLEKV